MCIIVTLKTPFSHPSNLTLSESESRSLNTQWSPSLGELHSKAPAISPEHEQRFLTNCAPPGFWQIIAGLSPTSLVWTYLKEHKFYLYTMLLEKLILRNLNFQLIQSINLGEIRWPPKCKSMQRHKPSNCIFQCLRKFSKKLGNHGALLWVLIKSQFLSRIALTLLHILTTLFLSSLCVE